MQGECLVVIPSVDERPNLETLIPAILEGPLDADVLVVDDGSRDGTPELVQELATETGRVALLARARRLGLGSAYVAAFRRALAESPARFVVQMDGDWSHHPRYLPGLVERARKGADVVVGSRYLRGISVVDWDLKRLALSRFGAWYARTVTGLPLTDPTAGYKCLRRAVLETIDLGALRSGGYAFQIELSHRAWARGFRVVEVPIVFTERRAGESKLNPSIALEAAWRCLELRLSGRRPPA
ncbi:MAG: polyprenol monophosphomannose synthase [Myxococcota bacterium]|nr:polyprenol monophosphomannose synthase [Myxococcota bacterium]